MAAEKKASKSEKQQASQEDAKASGASAQTRKHLSQSDIPAFSLEKALAVARAIGENYAFRASSPLDVASALSMTPTTGSFRMLTGASLAYGLTSGSYSANEIAITALGMRIVRPLTDDGDDEKAKKEAALIPKLAGDFLRRYDGAALPKVEIAQNVLQSMGVPAERTADALGMILENANSVGLLRQINDKSYVDLKNLTKAAEKTSDALPPRQTSADEPQTFAENLHDVSPVTLDEGRVARLKRVFITHGKNRALIDPIQKLAAFGDLQAVVSVNSHTASLSVPEKILEEMRSCGAAIILVENERTLVDAEGNPQTVLNDNVLIEIGAAMALFGKRFILIVKDGVKLPSNLQGLIELRYKGETLDVNDTVNLLGAMSDMKGRSLPG